MKHASALTFFSLVVLSSFAARASGPSPADDKAACLDASASAQTLRASHKLLAARDQLRICTRQVCPGAVQKDCGTWLDAVEQSLPTVVILAKDEAGRDVVDVKATIDGQPFAASLQGEALPLDPGSHVAHLEVSGGATADQSLVVREGGKNQTFTVIVRTGAAAAPLPAGSPAPPPMPASQPDGPEASSGLGTQRVLGIVAAGAGIAGVGLGAVFGLLASSAWNSQKSDCASATSCSDHSGALTQHSTLDTDSTISTVGFVAGGALLAGGAILFFTAGKPSESAGTGWLLAPSVAPGSAGFAMRRGF